MAACLPAFPRFVFTIFEPISLLAGSIPALLWPEWFLSEQLAAPLPLVSSAHAKLITQQLGNGYGMAFMIAMAVLYTSNEPKVIRNYLVALWLADIGHVGLTLAAIGWRDSLDVGAWNPMTWGNVAVTVFLFTIRSAYFLGLFGPDTAVPASKKAQ